MACHVLLIALNQSYPCVLASLCPCKLVSLQACVLASMPSLVKRYASLSPGDVNLRQAAGTTVLFGSSTESPNGHCYMNMLARGSSGCHYTDKEAMMLLMWFTS